MSIGEFLSGSHNALTVQRVFGEPIERDGVTVIPVASLSGGGGGQGGGGTGEKRGEGGGGGYGLRASPAGVYVIKDGQVSWQPAIDTNRIIMGGQAIVVAILLAIWAIVRARSQAEQR